MTDTLVVPEPIDWDDVLVKDESDGLVPHSNHAFVARPLAVTLPFRVAVVAPCQEDLNFPPLWDLKIPPLSVVSPWVPCVERSLL